MTPEQAASKYNWVQYDPETKVISLLMDNHMLSTLRMCESKFVEEHIFNIRPNGGHSWSLSHGAYLHSCFEYFYNSMRDGKICTIQEFLANGKELWFAYDLDYFKNEDKYQEIRGLEGSLGLLTMYYAYYYDLRLRVIGTEIPFGFNKEVPIGEFEIIIGYNPCDYNPRPIRLKCYLTGRIDLMVDNGYKIGPVDHKHSHKFRGDEWTKFNPHDGLTGYIYTTNAIMKQAFPKYFEQNRQCLSGWIFHISACMPIPRDKTKQLIRFKSTPIDKTPEMLEDYRLRQITTFKRVADLLFNEETPQWSTDRCHFMFGRKCEYIPIHEAPAREKEQIVNRLYHIAPQWNPEQIDEDNYIGRDKNVTTTETVLSGGSSNEQS